jgi:hypothetical protein
MDAAFPEASDLLRRLCLRECARHSLEKENWCGSPESRRLSAPQAAKPRERRWGAFGFAEVRYFKYHHVLVEIEF